LERIHCTAGKLSFTRSSVRSGAEIAARYLVFAELDQLPQVVDAVVGHAHEPRREARVAPRLLLRCSLEDENPMAVLFRRECGAQRGVAAADHDDVVFVHQSALMFAFWMTSFQRACSFAM
jgi:hypothetical protein